MLKSPGKASGASGAVFEELVAEFRFIHDVEEPSTSDLLRIEQVVQAQERLDDIRAEISRDGLTVAGSKGQSRPRSTACY